MKDLLASGGNVLLQLEEAGYEGVYAGGMVRDLLCGREPRDMDIACSAPVHILRSLFPGGKILGPRGCEIFLLPLEEAHVQIFSYAGSSLEKDLERRDLTVNALALRRRGELAGSKESVSDVFAGRLRFNGRGEDRLAEDPLRALRLLRFAAALPGFRADEDSVRLCRTVRTDLPDCPGERIGREVRLGLGGKAPLFLRNLQRTGLLEAVFPNLAISREDFLRLLETEKVLEEWNAPLHLRAAAIFSFPEQGNPPDEEGATLAERSLQTFGWSTSLIGRTADLVRFKNLLQQTVSSGALAAIMAEKGPSFSADLIQFSMALSLPEERRPMLKENAMTLLAMAMRKSMEDEILPTGGEILRQFAIPSGRIAGELRKRAERENLERGFSDRGAAFAFLERETGKTGIRDKKE